MDLTDEAHGKRTDGEEIRVAARRLMTDGGQAESEESEEAAESESSQSDGAAENGQGAEGDQRDSESESGDQSESGDEQAESREDEGTPVLFLDLEGLFVDLLGLEVDLDEVELDVTATKGPGRLVGNLLSGVANLLGAGGSGLLSNLFGGSLFEGLLGGKDGEGGLTGDGGLLGGGDGEDGDSATSRLSNSVSDALADVPFDELLTTFLKELVNQFFAEDGDDEGSEASS
jgi:hypothetical protein